MVDTRDSGQRIANNRTLIFVFRANFDMIPMTNDGKRLIIVLRTLRMFPVKILMKRNLTDWLLMVISGNNLMINFMATIVRWQARRALSKVVLQCTAVPASRSSISPLVHCASHCAFYIKSFRMLRATGHNPLPATRLRAFGNDSAKGCVYLLNHVTSLPYWCRDITRVYIHYAKEK